MSGSALAPWAMMYDSDPNDYSGTILTSLNCRQNATNQLRPICPYRGTINTPATSDILKQHETEIDCLRLKSVSEIVSQVKEMVTYTG